MASTKATARSPRHKHYPNAEHPLELDPADVPDVYASLCKGDCMDPVYPDGVCLVFSKLEPPKNGDFVGFWLHPNCVDADEPPRRVKRLYMGLPPEFTLPWVPNPGDEAEPMLVFEQLNPPKLLSVRASKILAMHKVVGTAIVGDDGMATVNRQN